MKKRIFLSLILIYLLISVISAEIIISEQLKDVYNLGDEVLISAKIKSLTSTYGILQMNLICGGKEINFYKNGISLISGEEKNIEALLPLIEEVIGESRGICKIKASLLTDKLLTEEFRISDLMEVKANINKNTFNPQEELLISGNVTKESGSEINGFIDVTLSKEGRTVIKRTETISNGKFSLKIIIPQDMEAGEYLVTLTTYEKTSKGEITNKGFVSNTIRISQIPTSLELFFEKKEIKPGETLKVKAILHDQTGEKISSIAIISIKNENNNIIEQIEKETDDYIEYRIKDQQLPGEWKIVAISNQITAESSFKIEEYEKINTEIINKTVIITNTGNVLYNKTVLVKIGNESLNIDAILKVGESKKYFLAAPSGEYQVKILSQDGEEVEKSILLTGDAISIKEISEGAIEFVRHPFSWIFILIILVVVAFSIIRRNWAKNFFKKFIQKNHKHIHPDEKVISYKEGLVSPKNKAQLSLSIRGENQKSSIVCLRIKNYSEIGSNKGGAKEILQKITEMAEEVKAYIYENNECILFIFAPIATRNLENEMIAAELAQSMKKAIDNHNKLFKQKIEYGISAEHGEIIVKKEGNSMLFAGLGNFITSARKIASFSQEEVLIGEKLKEKIHSNAKLERRSSERGTYYAIKELRDKEKHQKFLSSFVKRLEKDTNSQKDQSIKDNTKETEESNI